MSDRDAENYAAISVAKEVHNKECPFGGQAIEIHLNPYDLDRLDWDEGEVICGLTVAANEKVNVGMMRVMCNGDLNDDGPSEEEEVKQENTDLVSV